MKTALTILSTLVMLLFTSGIIYGQVINEWDWDELGTDEGEFIEVFIANPQPADLSQYKIVEYETTTGSAGNEQGTHSLDEFTATVVIMYNGCGDANKANYLKLTDFAS